MEEKDKILRSAEIDAIHNLSKAVMLLADRVGHQDVGNLAEETMTNFHDAIKKYHAKDLPLNNRNNDNG